MDIQSQVLQNISVVCDVRRVEDVNDFLELGWKVLQVTSGYAYEENLEFKEIEKVSYTEYSLGWFGDRTEVQYPATYIEEKAPF
jgi:hypothetical protein